MGVDRRKPGYIIRKELQREKIRKRAAIRALKYEEMLRTGKGNEIARKCVEKIRKKQIKGK